MANAILSTVNHVDAATVTASAATGDLGPTNLQNPIIGRRWRTTVLTAHVDIDFGADKTVKVLVLRAPRGTTLPGGTVRHQLDADGGTPGAGAALDTGAIALGMAEGYGYHVYYNATGVTARYWRFTLAASGVSFVDLGRAWAGEGIGLSRNIAYGWQQRAIDLSTNQRSQRSGARYPDQRDRLWEHVVSLDTMGASDRDEVREILRAAGTSEQVLSIIDPSSSDVGRLSVIGSFIQPRSIIQPAYALYRARDLRITEDN